MCYHKYDGIWRWAWIIIYLTVKIQIQKGGGMRHDAKQLKEAINLYYPQHHQLKTKATPTISQYQLTPHPSNPTFKNAQQAINEIQDKCSRLHSRVDKESKTYRQTCGKLKMMVIAYYEDFIKMVRNEQFLCVSEIEAAINEGLKKFEMQKRNIEEVSRQVQVGYSKKNFQQIRVQFNTLAVVELPVFRFEANTNTINSTKQQFDRLLKQLKPIITGQQKRKQIMHESSIPNKPQMRKSTHNPETHKNSLVHEQEHTVKKVTHSPYYSEGAEDLCQFSCDQQFEWNPSQVDSRKFNRKETVSEIILEEPSSCEDSLMMSEVA